MSILPDKHGAALHRRRTCTDAPRLRPAANEGDLDAKLASLRQELSQVNRMIAVLEWACAKPAARN